MKYYIVYIELPFSFFISVYILDQEHSLKITAVTNGIRAQIHMTLCVHTFFAVRKRH